MVFFINTIFINTTSTLVKLQDDLEYMMEDADPEVTPGLFQGDMALTNENYHYWRVGIRWDVFPDKLWKNRTVPYVISPTYGKNRLKFYTFF